MIPQAVESRFELGRIHHVSPVASSGLSGAAVFRVQSERGAFAVKSIPEDYPLERLVLIHRVLQSAQEQGCSVVAVPVLDRSGRPYLIHDGTGWEVTSWMSGVADFNSQPTWERLDNAMRELAYFHSATARWECKHGQSPGIIARLTRIEEFEDGFLARARHTLDHQPLRTSWESWLRRAMHRLPDAVQRLRKAVPRTATQSFVLQPIARDLWHDHLLFTGNDVTGLIDFHAMRMDTPLLDLARLIGSLKIGGLSPWTAAIEYYSKYGPLPGETAPLLVWLHDSGVAWSLVNWIKWLVVERREFTNHRAVVSRLEMLVSDLEWSHENGYFGHASST